MSLERGSALFILNLWEMSDRELNTIKDLALQRGATETTCPSVRNCNSKPGTTSAWRDLFSPSLRMPQALGVTPVQAHLLLLLSSNTAVNPAQSFITKARKIMFWWYPLGSGPQLDKRASLQPWVKLQTNRVLTHPWQGFFPHPLHSRSPGWQFSCFGFNSKLSHLWIISFTNTSFTYPQITFLRADARHYKRVYEPTDSSLEGKSCWPVIREKSLQLLSSMSLKYLLFSMLKDNGVSDRSQTSNQTCSTHVLFLQCSLFKQIKGVGNAASDSNVTVKQR